LVATKLKHRSGIHVMPNERAEPSRPSWRGETRREPRPEVPEHEWSKRRLKPAGKSRLPGSGSWKLVSTIVGFLAFLVAIVVLIIMIQPPPPAAVVLLGADYADSPLVPHNVFGWEGIAGIEKVSRTPQGWRLLRSGSLQLIKPLQVVDHRERWDAVIEDLAKTGFSQDTLLIVVELHGGSDPDHGYLIPDKMAMPQDRLDLSQVIESMHKLPPNKQKILVLEGSQIPAYWRLGMLHNDFARRLEDLEQAIGEVPNLWVLSGADVDQQCWVSEGLGRTVFSHFIIEGLRGKAAASNGRLTLDGLYRYVRENVRKWSWNARGAIQEPVLFPRLTLAGRHQSDGNTASDAKPRKQVRRRPPGEVYLASVENAPAPAPPAPPDRQAIEDLWTGFHRLDAKVPHPAVYSPRRWRQYRADVVRYEELVRAGGSAKAGPVRERIDALARLLESDRLLRCLPRSAENTLAMKVLEGGRLETATAEPKEFLPYWEVKGRSDSFKVWASLRGSEDAAPPDLPSLRMRMDDFLLRRVIDQPVKNIEPAALKLEVSGSGSNYLQPAEAHFLRMFYLWREPLSMRPPRVAELLRRALSVRRLAERSALAASDNGSMYSYAEQIFPWIKTQIESADGARRLAEDQLFSSEESAWDRSEAAFKRASDGYRSAVQRADVIRAALAARDRSMAVLPDYSQWLVHRYSDELQNDLTAAVERLWEMTHKLTARLEKPHADGDVATLAAAANTLARGLDELRRKFDDQGSRMNESRLKEDWEAATAAAMVPFPDTGDLASRSRIWDRLDNIRRHDLEPAASDDSGPARLSEDDRLVAARHVRRRAQIQGLMAMAALGAPWFDQTNDSHAAGAGDFDSTVKRIRRVTDKEQERDGTWWKELAIAGSLIGQRWQRMAPAIETLTDEKSGIANFGEFENRLAAADRLGRQLDWAAPRLEEPAIEATVRLRQARVHDLLLAMARRAWLDHWFDEKSNDTPYYQLAASRLLSDASKLFPESPRVRETQENLKGGKLEITGPARRILTSEMSTSIAYKVRPVGEVPEGIPVLKPVVDQLELDGDLKGFRCVQSGSGSDSIGFTVSSPLISRAEKDPRLNHPKIDASSLFIEGSFRGQPLTFRTEIPIHAVADTVAIGPPPPDPPDASIAVRASQEIIDQFGAGTGSIAIVLDCSGSMMDPSGAGRNTKFDDAQTALRDVLKLVPPKTRISLWTFSQLPADAVRLPNGKVDARSVPAGLEQEPELTIKPLVRPAPWDPNQANQLVDRIGQLEPFFGTPLVQAMWAAANTDLKAATGIKTLLVLTDGNDNRLANNPKYNPDKLSVPEFIVAGFKPLNIRVNMIFFTPAGEKREIEAAAKNFEGALKRLDPPGNFVFANNVNELITTLRRGSRQKLTCEILKPPDWTPVSDEPLDVAGPGDDDRWWSAGLEPMTYKLRIHADKPYEHEIDLKKGERAIIRLVDVPEGGIAFQRAMYSDDDRRFPGRVQTESAAWRLAVLANQRRRQGDDERLQIFAALEKRPDEPGPERLQQINPGMAWFRLEALDRSETPLSVRWQEQIFYPGPSWHLLVPRWVTDPGGVALARPILKAWWRAPETKIQPGPVLAFDSPGSPGELPRSLPIEDGKSVTIESLGVEDHHVTLRLGEPALRDSCLVVRLEFPKNYPYIIDPKSLTGLQVVGYEHRLYSEAGKYTGLFWPVNQPKLEKLRSLSLIAIDAFRNQADNLKCKIDLKLPPPRAEDQIPKPPAAILKGN
jgi:hypothetical protein